jgi:ABC-2 type transport system permease protein
MSSNSEFQLVTGSGPWRGFSNLFQKENQAWWAPRRALTMAALWAALIDGLLALALFVLPHLTGPQGEPLIPEDPLQLGSEMFVGVFILALAIGIIVLLQDAIIGEKQMGTAAWVLSKPVSRSAFLGAKTAASLIGVLCLMILLPAIVGYFLFWLYEPGAIIPTNFAAAMGVVALHSFFYLTLTLLMGVLADSRGVLLAVTLGSLLGGGLVPFKELVQIAPWQLPQVGLLLLRGQALGTMEWTMIIATGVWSIAFLLVALWRINRIEF